MGTVVTYGRGEAVVTGTGMRTEIGAIAATLQSVRREATPLQRRLDELGRGLALAALVIVGVIFGLGLLRGEDLRLMFLTAVSMAVAAVPEGLPAVVTIALALGAQRMLHRRALVRKLAAVETLGSVTVICSDKTGTLTENRMRVTALHVAGRRVDPDTQATPEASVALLLAGGSLCSDAVEAAESGGDPTEVALVTAAARAGLHKTDLETAYPRVAERPFDSARKLMTTVHALARALPPLDDVIRAAAKERGDSPSHVAFTKGAVDRLLAVCSHVWTGGTIVRLDDGRARALQTDHDALAADGMRVLGVAFRPLTTTPAVESLERDLVYIGLTAMIDPPRPEARDAIATCSAAGIRTVMITGDHPLTARHVAERLGMTGSDRMLTGAELARMTPGELVPAVDEVGIYARVSPEHKFQIVDALQARGQIVAMTGDGVNDAPALMKADIGVAMGITGTDVSKEAADTVLLDDNFATIVAAVEEGRIIYDNIRKFVKYLLTTNSAELWLMLVAPLVGMPLPLLPLQILWINLVTDGPTALTLGVEPAERGVMSRPPRPPRESVFARGLGRHVMWVGVFMASLTLALGYWYWRAGRPQWQSVVFTTLAMAQMAHVLAIRSERQSLLTIGLWSNPWLAGAVAVTVLLQLAVLYVPLLQRVFDTVALGAADLAAVAAVAAAVLAAVEAEKWWIRRVHA
jgi:Ca2+-transporting ATPase